MTFASNKKDPNKMASKTTLREDIIDDIDRSASLFFDKYLGPTTALKVMARFTKKAKMNTNEVLEKNETEVIMQDEILTTPNAIVNAPATRTKKYSMRVHAVGTGIPINQQILQNDEEMDRNNMFKVVSFHRIVVERTVYILEALLRVPHSETNVLRKATNYMNLARLIGNGMTINGWTSANISYIGNQYSSTLAPQSIFAMVVDLQSHGMLSDKFPIKNEPQLLQQYNSDWIEPKEFMLGDIRIVTIPAFYSGVNRKLNLRVSWNTYFAAYVTIPRSTVAKQYRLAWPNWRGGAWAKNVNVLPNEDVMILAPVQIDGTYGIIAYGTQAPVDFVEGAKMYNAQVKDANTHMETMQYKVVMGAKVLENRTDNVLVIPCRTVTEITASGSKAIPNVVELTLTGDKAADLAAFNAKSFTKDDIVIIHLNTVANGAAIKAAYQDAIYANESLYDLESLLTLQKQIKTVYDPEVRTSFMKSEEIDLHVIPNLAFGLDMPAYIENTDALNITVATAPALTNVPRPNAMIDCSGPGKTLAFGVKENNTLVTELPAFSYERFYNMCAAARNL